MKDLTTNRQYEKALEYLWKIFFMPCRRKSRKERKVMKLIIRITRYEQRTLGGFLVNEFPLIPQFLNTPYTYVDLYEIPWELINPHEEQAKANHGGQSLKRLAERGGLSFTEALAVMEDRPWRQIAPEEAFHRLKEMVDEYNREQESKL
jgi:hypothetical protein